MFYPCHNVRTNKDPHMINSTSYWGKSKTALWDIPQTVELHVCKPEENSQWNINLNPIIHVYEKKEMVCEYLVLAWEEKKTIQI